MAIPLEPHAGMFPETHQEPFVFSDELETLVNSILAGYDEFRDIDEAIRDGMSIACVWETKPFDPLEDEITAHVIAKVTKASPLWRCLSGHQYVIQFRKAFWDAFDDRQRAAVCHHELNHIEITTDSKGRAKYGTREHDVEHFTSTMRKFGPILPNLQEFVKASLDWHHAQEHPEPTPLRPLSAEVLVDAIVDRADDLQATADKLGGDITVTANGRSRTIRSRKPGAAHVAADDDTDLRPAGEVNEDELRGDVDRALDDEGSPA